MITTFNQHVIIALNLVRKLCHGRLYKLRNGLEEPLLCEEKERGKQRLPRLLTPSPLPTARETDNLSFPLGTTSGSVPYHPCRRGPALSPTPAPGSKTILQGPAG